VDGLLADPLTLQDRVETFLAQLATIARLINYFSFDKFSLQLEKMLD
jgi:hypothetical protein